MELDSKQIMEEALKLPAKLRGNLAARLLESLDNEPDFDDDEAWEEEIERRVHEVRADPNSCVPWEEARKMIMRDDD